MIIKECNNTEEILATFPVMRELRANLNDATEYLALVRSLQKTDGYKLIAMIDENSNCLAVAGIRIKRSLFTTGQSIIYVDDLVTASNCRSKGLGREMMVWLKSACKRLGCVGIILDSGTQRTLAHKFYNEVGMAVTALHFAWQVD